MKDITLREAIRYEICDGKRLNLYKIIKKIMFDIHSRFIFLIRLLFWFKKGKRNILLGLVSRYLITRFGCFVGSNSEIGLGVQFPHPNGIVIGENVKIGNNCIIYQQVTFGGKNIGDGFRGFYPKISENVTIFSGAKLIGKIVVGKYAVIGANSVVNHDVPPYAVVAGIPAKIIKYTNQLT